MLKYPYMSCLYDNRIYNKEFLAFLITCGSNLENGRDHMETMAKVIAGFFNDVDLSKAPPHSYVRCTLSCDFSYLKGDKKIRIDIEAMQFLSKLQNLIERKLHSPQQFVSCIDIVFVEVYIVQAHMYMLVPSNTPRIDEIGESQSEIYARNKIE